MQLKWILLRELIKTVLNCVYKVSFIDLSLNSIFGTWWWFHNSMPVFVSFLRVMGHPTMVGLALCAWFLGLLREAIIWGCTIKTEDLPLQTNFQTNKCVSSYSIWVLPIMVCFPCVAQQINHSNWTLMLIYHSLYWGVIDGNGVARLSNFLSLNAKWCLQYITVVR